MKNQVTPSLTCNKSRAGRNDEPLINKRLEKSSLNVSAGRVFYERARSRRERHSLILSTMAQDAVPLSRSGERGPGRASDLPHEFRSDRTAKVGGHDDDAEKVQELIRCGRAAADKMLAKKRSLMSLSSRSRNSSSTKRRSNRALPHRSSKSTITRDKKSLGGYQRRSVQEKKSSENKARLWNAYNRVLSKKVKPLGGYQRRSVQEKKPSENKERLWIAYNRIRSKSVKPDSIYSIDI